jgi:transposase
MAESKYTPERVERIIKAVKAGLPFVTAAALGGVSEATFYNCMKNKKNVEFLEAIKAAEAEAEERLVEQISVDPSWQSKAWILERRHPDRWGRVDRNKVELTGRGGDPIQVVSNMSDEEVISRARRILDTRPGNTQ